MKPIQKIEDQCRYNRDQEQQQARIHSSAASRLGVWGGQSCPLKKRLCAFQRHRLKHVGGIFGLVGREFQHFIEFLDLD